MKTPNGQIKDIDEFVAKIDEMKKKDKMDLSRDQDLAIAIMNLVSIEEHFFFTAEKTGERVRRHRIPLNFKDQNISVNITHNTVNESMCLLDYGVDLEEYINQ